MPTGDLAAVDPETGGLATSEFGFGGRIVVTLTGRMALFLSWTRHRFGFDNTMYADYHGEQSGITDHEAVVLAAGLRYYIPNVTEHMPYLQVGAGRYRYRVSGILDQSQAGHTDEPVFGYVLGGGTILPLGTLALDLSIDLHSSRFTFIEGFEERAGWLAFSGCLTLAIR
jgi:hypothetical protein